MTNVTQAEAEAIAITVHSRAAMDTEILIPEFIACYLAADIAWQYERNDQGLEKAAKGTRGRLERLLGFKSPMRGLPVSSTHAPSATPYLLLLIQIRLVSIHGQDIRILTMYFTEEYYQSFQKANRSTAGIYVRIESFHLPGCEDAQISTMVEVLRKPSTWLQKQMETSNK
jgi:hypothetical protein